MGEIWFINIFLIGNVGVVLADRIAIFVDTVSGRKSLDFNLTNNSETIISDSIDGGRYDFINNNVQRGIVEIDGETVDTRYNISINGDKTSKITFNDVYAY